MSTGLKLIEFLRELLKLRFCEFTAKPCLVDSWGLENIERNLYEEDGVILLVTGFVINFLTYFL